jgi:hypothetical protein
MDKAAPDSLTTLREELRHFAADRDWEQFHSPKNLVARDKLVRNACKYPIATARGSSRKSTG